MDGSGEGDGITYDSKLEELKFARNSSKATIAVLQDRIFCKFVGTLRAPLPKPLIFSSLRSCPRI